jgi:hypothetical protein
VVIRGLPTGGFPFAGRVAPCRSSSQVGAGGSELFRSNDTVLTFYLKPGCEILVPSYPANSPVTNAGENSSM